ncbi:MAG: hypothetical protein FJW34_08095 [Acidobacteria bacterium]|nr:hypothetical protein [Acidobacteriota bacterium]
MSQQSEPLALQLYRRFRSGKSVEQLAAETAIPIDRVRLRVQAGAAFWQRCAQSDPMAECNFSLVSLCQQLGEAA